MGKNVKYRVIGSIKKIPQNNFEVFVIFVSVHLTFRWFNASEVTNFNWFILFNTFTCGDSY
jgi:hypothetical protein